MISISNHENQIRKYLCVLSETFSIERIVEMFEFRATRGHAKFENYLDRKSNLIERLAILYA